jgi:hypothetical protein
MSGKRTDQEIKFLLEGISMLSVKDKALDYLERASQWQKERE